MMDRQNLQACRDIFTALFKGYTDKQWQAARVINAGGRKNDPAWLEHVLSGAQERTNSKTYKKGA